MIEPELGQMEPLYDRVLIEPLSEERQTRNGLFIPDGFSVSGDIPESSLGIVRAVGSGAPNSGLGATKDEMVLRVGDKVFYIPQQASPAGVGVRTYVIIREKNVLGRLGDVDMNCDGDSTEEGGIE